MCNKDTDGKCIAEILTVICILQQNANCSESCLDTCDRGFLGNSTTCLSCNTRPIMLYTCGGGNTAFAMPISKDPAVTTTSTVFRLEKLDGCCATCRVLAPNTDETSVFPYEATNSFFTINLGCCCILRCLDDTVVESI